MPYYADALARVGAKYAVLIFVTDILSPVAESSTPNPIYRPGIGADLFSKRLFLPEMSARWLFLRRTHVFN